MRLAATIATAGLAATAGPGATAAAESGVRSEQGRSEQGRSEQGGGEQKIIYVPRDGTAQKTRIVGQTRDRSSPAAVAVLAPDGPGETTLAQPTLYWFLSQPVQSKVEVVVTDESNQKTVFETQLDPPQAPGVAAVSLGKFRVSLAPDRDYRWSVSVVRDPAERSMDLFASGVVRRRAAMPGEMAMRINHMPPADMPFYLAENGLWYDALAVLSVQIARNPDDRRLRALRADLMDQVGLPQVAAYDRR